MSSTASSQPDNAKTPDAAASTTVDSGFFSQEISSQECSGLLAEQQQQAMRLDSGIDTLQLSQQLRAVHLDCNDLGGKPRTTNLPAITTAAQQERTWEPYFDQDVNGDTCLHTAIMEGFVEAARILIRMAPHPMLLDTHNDEAQSPLHLAVLTQQWAVVRWLVAAGARPNARNLAGDSPLHVAARGGDVAACAALTKPVERKEAEGMDLLYAPKHARVNLEQWNYEGQTALHVAAIYGHIDVMRHLLACGADINAREGKSGYTPLHIAVEAGNDQMASCLITDCKQMDFAVYTYGGRSVLQLEHDLDYKLREMLLLQGVPAYISSEDESDNDDDCVMVESQF